MKTVAAVLYEMGIPAPYAESKPLQIAELELSGPGPGEVLLEIAAAGLCHSDLSVVDGVRPRVMPMVLGHEASGIVREVGAGVSAFSPGDHVVLSYVPVCGRCPMCAEGRASLCESGAKANGAGELLGGTRRFRDANGQWLHHHLGVSAFSQFTVVAQESLVKIDADIPLQVAALFGCAALTGIGSVVNTARVGIGESVAIFGLGGVGLCAVMGAKLAGAYPIVVVDKSESKRDLALELGATHFVLADENTVPHIRDVTSGGVRYAFECVGNDKVLTQAYEATRRGGTTVSIGLPHPSRKIELQIVGLIAEERTLKGAYMGSAVPQRDIPRYLSLYRAGRLPMDRLMSRTIGLNDINAAFDTLASGELARQLLTF